MNHAVIARVVRSGFVEGEHYGSAVAVGGDGAVVAAVGAVHAPIFARSANKPLQAVAMLRAGLALDGSLLALASSSHSGERYHLDGVQRLLTMVGLDESALQNTPALPLGVAEHEDWQRSGRPASRLGHNCSGKHAAMLATCLINGWPLEGYLSPDHPIQRLISDTVAELAAEPVAAVGVDGCGAPVLAISVLGLARALARVATALPGTAEGRVAAAIRTHPEWVGGTGRDVTALMRAVPGLIAKDGAEAVYVAALPDGRAAAVKVADGSDRARLVVLVSLLRRLGVAADELDALAQVPVLGHGEPVGAVEAVEV